MSKLLVELMGGQIGVESSVGIGSVFWFELDTADPPALQDALAETKPDPVASTQDHQPARTVLCVEDNPANLDLIQQLIGRRPSLNLLSAGEARLGIKLALDHLPDVILMDINLPGMDGLEAMAILRDGPTTARIPVVAVSANAMVGDIQKGMDAGFFRYITKPINVPEFMKALDDALEASERMGRDAGAGAPGP
jgi:CheY-like chemotaxis protein